MAAVVLAAAVASCGDDDAAVERPDTEAPEATVVVDDVIVEAEVDGEWAVLQVRAPDDRRIGVADAAMAGRRVEGDTVTYRRIVSAGEEGAVGAEGPSGRVLVVQAGETLELPSDAGLDPDTARVCLELIDPLQHGDDDLESGDDVVVDEGPGNQFVCVEVDGA